MDSTQPSSSGRGDDFTFPTLPSTSQPVPLTARSTVVDASSSGQPRTAQSANRKQQLNERTKDDPFLTRVLYRLLAWATNVPLEKGYSQVDWLRLSNSNPNLNGLGGMPPRKDITMGEVKQHKTADDAWMVFNGKVYNITPYLRFHPGGQDILVKVAGKDGTSLFMKYHPWVNINALMEKCLVGYLEQSLQKVSEGSMSSDMSDAPASSSGSMTTMRDAR